MNMELALRIFGVEALSGDKELINKRYKQLSATYHPDRGGSHATMILINSARDFLMEYSPSPQIDVQKSTESTEAAAGSSARDDKLYSPNRSEYHSSPLGLLTLIILLVYIPYADYEILNMSTPILEDVFIPLSLVTLVGAFTRLIGLNRKTSAFYVVELMSISILSGMLGVLPEKWYIAVFSVIAFGIIIQEVRLAERVLKWKRSLNH